MSEIREYEAMMQHSGYVPNTAQKRLAEEVTRIIHGQEGLDTALRVTQAAAPGASTALDATVLESISHDMMSHSLSKDEVVGKKVVDIIVKVGLQPSKGEGRRLIRNGGVYLNNEKVTDENAMVSSEDLIEGRLLLISTGKKNKVLIHIL